MQALWGEPSQEKHASASSPGSRVLCYLRTWYFFSRDLTYLIARGKEPLTCISLPSAGNIVSALGLWYKGFQRVATSSIDSLRCLRTASVLAHAKIHPSTLRITYVRKSTRPTVMLK